MPDGETVSEGELEGETVPERVGAGVPLSEDPWEAVPVGVTALLGVTGGETVDVSVELPDLDLVPVGLPEGVKDCEGVKEGDTVPERDGGGVPLSEDPWEAVPVGVEDTLGVPEGELVGVVVRLPV